MSIHRGSKWSSYFELLGDRPLCVVVSGIHFVPFTTDRAPGAAGSNTLFLHITNVHVARRGKKKLIVGLWKFKDKKQIKTIDPSVLCSGVYCWRKRKTNMRGSYVYIIREAINFDWLSLLWFVQNITKT